MAYCPECGEEVEDEAVMCPECGEQFEALRADEGGGAHGQAGAHGAVGAHGEARGHERDRGARDLSHMRDNWWHVVLALPIALPVAGLHEILVVTLVLPLLLLFPFAVWYDTKYVRAASDTWQPSKGLAVALGLLGLVSLGILSYLISPAYLLMRWRHV